MSEKVLGIIQVVRPAFARVIDENLFIASDRVVVARTKGVGSYGGGLIADIIAIREGSKKNKELGELSLESVLKADKHNFSIPNSEIIKVELKKGWTEGKGKLKMITSKKKHEWKFIGLLPEKKGVKLEDYENILRPAFGDKLFVKK